MLLVLMGQPHLVSGRELGGAATVNCTHVLNVMDWDALTSAYPALYVYIQWFP